MYYPILDTKSTPPRIVVRPGVEIDANSSSKTALDEFCYPSDFLNKVNYIDSPVEAQRTVFALKELDINWLSISFEKIDTALFKRISELRNLHTLIINAAKVSHRSYSKVDDLVALFSGMKNLKHLELNFEVTDICDELAKDREFRYQYRLVEMLGIGCQSLKFVQTITDGVKTSWEISQSTSYGNRWAVPRQKSGPERLRTSNSFNPLAKERNKFYKRRWTNLGGLSPYSVPASPEASYAAYPTFPSYNGMNNLMNNTNPMDHYYMSMYKNGMHNGTHNYTPYAYGPGGRPVSVPLAAAPVAPAWGHDLQDYPEWAYEDYNPEDYPEWCVIRSFVILLIHTHRHRKRHQVRPIHKHKSPFSCF